MKLLLRKIHQWDLRFFSVIFRLNRKNILSSILYYITKTGDGYLYPIVFLLARFITPQSSSSLTKAGLLAFGIELPIYRILKNGIKRYRPFEVLEGIQHLIVPSDRFSFPSGHTSAATLMAILFSFFFPILTAPLFLWALSVGVSRIFMGVHYPLDVLAGSVLGYLSATASLLILGY